MTTDSDPPIVLVLRPAPGHWSAPVERRLARALKSLLRSHGLRCEQVRSSLPANAPPAIDPSTLEE